MSVPDPKLHRRSIVVAALSTVVEWYDFTLYLYFSTVLARVFFGPGAASLIATLGGFAVAYLMRPVGALVFGHIGDRRGRRPMLLLSMAVMSAAMLATALLPTQAQIGPLAAWLLVLPALRDGLLGRRGIYRGRRLSARERAAGPPRPRRLAGRGVERDRRAARRRRGGADRQRDVQRRSGKLGLADSLPGRGGACRGGLAGALDDGRIAGFRAAARGGEHPAQSAPARALEAARRESLRALRHLGARIDHLLCRHHLCARLPHLGRVGDRGGIAVALHPRRDRRHPRHPGRRRCSPTGSGRKPVLLALAAAERRPADR